jgi:hypothetical protein
MDYLKSAFASEEDLERFVRQLKRHEELRLAAYTDSPWAF